MNPKPHKENILWTACMLAAVSTPVFGQDDSTVYELNPFEVKATKGYIASSTVSATGLNTPLLEVPMSITVLTSDFLSDSNIGGYEQAFDYTASVTIQDRSAGNTMRSSITNIRGFANNNNLVDGVNASGFIPPILIERIEVVKGPNTLYGQTDPGGLVNVVTKKPLPESGGSLTLKVGDYSWLQGQADVTVRGLDNKLGLRLLADYWDTDTWIKHGWATNRFFGLSGQHDFNKNVTFSFLAGSTEIDKSPDSRTAISFQRIPTDLNGDGDFNDTVQGVAEASARYNSEWWPRHYTYQSRETNQHQEEIFLKGRLDVRLNDNNRVSYQFSKNDGISKSHFRTFNTFAAPSDPNDPDTATATGFYWSDDSGNTDEVHSLNYNTKIEMEAMRHEILVGARFGESEGYDRNASLNTGNAGQRAIIAEFEQATGKDIRLTLTRAEVLSGEDLWNEDSFTYEELRAWAPRGSVTDLTVNKLKTYFITDNVYLMDERLNILAGVRYTDIKQTAYDIDFSDGSRTTLPGGADESDFSYQFGTVYRLNQNLSVYGNYADSFEPNSAVNSETGESYGNITGEAIEAGLKFEGLLNGKVTGSVGVFKVQKSNLVREEFDPTTGGVIQSVTSDESKGVEVELFVKPTANWDIVISYTNMDAVVVGAVSPELEGLWIEGASPERLSIFTSIEVLKGLRIGGGMTYADGPIQQFGNPPNRLIIEDGFTEFDLFARYSTEIFGNNVIFGVNIDNVGDEFYFRGRAGKSRPRTVLFSVTTQF